MFMEMFKCGLWNDTAALTVHKHSYINFPFNGVRFWCVSFPVKEKESNMVTCNIDSVKKMERPKRGSGSGSTSSGFRLLDDHCDTVSSISRNSIYKIKIDSMFDDTR